MGSRRHIGIRHWLAATLAFGVCLGVFKVLCDNARRLDDHVRELRSLGCTVVTKQAIPDWCEVVCLQAFGTRCASVSKVTFGSDESSKKFEFLPDPSHEDSIVRQIGELGELDELDLSGIPLNDELLSVLSNLRVGKVTLSTFQATESGFGAISRMGRVNALKLLGACLDGLEVRQLATMPSLRTLELHCGSITTDGIGEMARLRSLEAIVMFRMKSERALDVTAWRDLPKLESVDIRFTNVEPESTNLLSKQVKHLECAYGYVE